MSCPFCASENPSEARFCRACGAELPRVAANGAASSDALPIGALLGGTYAVESVLGQGGFGITYGCHDRMLDRRVAIKEFFPAGCRREDAAVQPSRGLSDTHFSEARAQFLAEARLLARCHHAGIVAVHTAFEANSTAYMVMELLHGSHLAQLLELRGGRLTEAEAVPLIERAGEALKWVHDKGLLHRDIKPENIIATDDGRVMLIDFGTAREYAQGQAQGHTIVVTPGYAPLEQYAKQAKRGAFTDVYGLAATLYHLLTGQAPPAASDRAVGVQLRPVREENSQISQNVARAIESGLEMEIAKRPQSVREFLELMRAPAVQAVAAADFEVAWKPRESAITDPEWDALLMRAAAPPHLFPGALQARQQMLDAAVSTPQSAQPVQLAPIVTPPPILPTTTAAAKTPTALYSNLSSNLPSAMSSNTGGGFMTQSTHDYDAEVSKFALWSFGGIAAFIGFIFLLASGSRSTRSPNYLSPGVSYSAPNYSSYQPSSPNYSTSTTRNFEAAREAARRQLNSTPAILPVSVETLPISPTAERGRTATSASNSQIPYILTQGVAEFSPDGQLVAYVDREAVVRVWSLSKHRVVSSLPQSKTHPPAAIRFSPDAKKVVLSYQHQGSRRVNDQVTVWNLATEKSVGTLLVDVTTESLTAHAVLPDGKVLITQRPLGLPRPRYSLWNPRTGKQSAPSAKEMASVRSVIFSPDGKQIVTGDEAGRIRWWDARTGAKKSEHFANLTYRNSQTSASDSLTRAEAEDSNFALRVQALRFSGDGSYLASRNARQIRLFNSKAQEIATLPIAITSTIAVSPDGRFVVESDGSSSNGQSLLWNVRTGQKIRLQGALGRLNVWNFSPDGKQVIGLSSSSERVSLVTWPTDAKPVASFSGPQITPLSLPTSSYGAAKALSPSNQLVAMQTGERLEIRRFDGSLINVVDVGSSLLTEMAFSLDGRFVSGRVAGGEARLWNVQTGQQLGQLEAWEPVQAKSSQPLRYGSNTAKTLMFSPDNSLFAWAGTSQGKSVVEAWSLKKTPRRIASLTLSQPATVFTFSSDNRALICSEANGKLRLFDLATQKLTAEIETGATPITQLVSTEQGLAVVSDEKIGMRVTLYELPSGQKRQTFLKKNQIVISSIYSGHDAVAVSPDGRFVATAPFLYHVKTEVHIWNPSTGSLMQKMPVPLSHDAAFPPGIMFVDAFSFSPDGTRLNGINRDYAGRVQQLMSWQIPPREKPSP